MKIPFVAALLSVFAIQQAHAVLSSHRVIWISSIANWDVFRPGIGPLILPIARHIALLTVLMQKNMDLTGVIFLWVDLTHGLTSVSPDSYAKIFLGYDANPGVPYYLY